MTESLLPQFQRLFEAFRQTEDYLNRVAQTAITPIFREIIVETLRNDPLQNEHLTGLIQMFKPGCSEKTFDHYLEMNVADQDKRADFIHKLDEIGQEGFTGAGKFTIQGLDQNQLREVRNFLLASLEINTIEDAVRLCRDFDAKNIPQVKAGIYSPWLYYINPQLFPILNNSHKRFSEWLGMPSNYADCIPLFGALRALVNENDLGMLDQFAYKFADYRQSGALKTLDLEGRRFYKVSHGVFVKSPNYRNTGIVELFEKNNWICVHAHTGKKQGEKFIQAEIGDYVYLCYGGDQLHCIGKITSEAQPLDTETDNLIDGKGEWIYRVIEPLYFPDDKSVREFKNDPQAFMPSGNTTFWEVPKDKLDYINKSIFIPKWNLQVVDHDTGRSMPTDKTMESQFSKSPMNSILYGPPGTGKTYRTIDHALAILDNKSVEAISLERENDEDGVKERFDKYHKNGRIAFCTFHQSMSYEDFIEGIRPLRPDTDEDKPMQYAVVDGILKRLCTEAIFGLASLATGEPTDRVVDFSLAYDRFVADVQERLSRGEPTVMKTVTNGNIVVDSISQQNNLIVKHRGFERIYTVSKHRLSRLANAIPDLKAVSNISAEFTKIIGGMNASVYWAALNAIRNFEPQAGGQPRDLSGLTYEDKKEAIRDFELPENIKEKAKRFVLIIDEINRGNVAQIFGELITLIEEDKRMGAKSALKAMLPYSNESFCVPPNLYIIGTMNTADRSVEALDTALRRRFSFIHMRPEPDKLNVTREGIDLNNMLTRINKRLEVLLDADHTIGHAWLWGVNDLAGLRLTFKDKILPLLQEFFYNDYEKIGLVLGDAFVQSKPVDPKAVFANFTNGNGLADEYAASRLFYLKDIKDIKAEDFSAI